MRSNKCSSHFAKFLSKFSAALLHAAWLELSNRVSSKFAAASLFNGVTNGVYLNTKYQI